MPTAAAAVVAALTFRKSLLLIFMFASLIMFTLKIAIKEMLYLSKSLNVYPCFCHPDS
jgi:hypothetical protein